MTGVMWNRKAQDQNGKITGICRFTKRYVANLKKKQKIIESIQFLDIAVRLKLTCVR